MDKYGDVDIFAFSAESFVDDINVSDSKPKNSPSIGAMKMFFILTVFPPIQVSPRMVLFSQMLGSIFIKENYKLVINFILSLLSMKMRNSLHGYSLSQVKP